MKTTPTTITNKTKQNKTTQQLNKGRNLVKFDFSDLTRDLCLAWSPKQLSIRVGFILLLFMILIENVHVSAIITDKTKH